MNMIAEVAAKLRAECQNLLAELSRIDRVLTALEETAGLEPIPAAPAITAHPLVVYPTDVLGRTPRPYSMLSVCEAAAVYLASVGEPKTSREITDALRAGSLRTTSKSLTDTVRKMLRRSGSYCGISATSNKKRWFMRNNRSSDSSDE